MRILYTGPIARGSVTRAKMDGLVALGHDVVPLDHNPYLDRVPRVLRKAQIHMLIGPGISAYNRDLLDLARHARPDLVYVDQGSYLRPKTVVAMRTTGAKLVHYTSEYLGLWMYQHWYRHFWPAVRSYDAHIVTNELSRKMLEERGVRSIVMSEFGYDPAVHRPQVLVDSEKQRFASDLLFVGHWEPDRSRLVAALRQAGLNVKVWGKGWWRAFELHDRREIEPITSDDYPKAIAAAKAALCFLSKWNRNTSCGRTFEIPAIGSLLLAERTGEQTAYFAEGREAAFFGSLDELIHKARHFLAHGEERTLVARAGHERCARSAYTYRDRIEHDITAVFEVLGYDRGADPAKKSLVGSAIL
jgi:hypothetical protein